MVSVINNSIGVACVSVNFLLRRYPIHNQHCTRSFYKAVSAYFAKKKKPKVAVLNLCGMIQADTSNSIMSGVKKLSLESLRKPIDKAFATKGIKEVCLVINSPGGSAVQSDLIAKRIMHLSKTKQIDVVSFVEDYGASGGYWLACAGKQIYITENSVTGSIGVIAASFGLQDLIKRFDIERRVEKMGKHKGMMDPFQPETQEEKEILQKSLARIYQNFINYVKRQRGDRLTSTDDVLFTGQFWVGQDAVDLGLVDGIKTLDEYLYERYGEKVQVVYVNPIKKTGLRGLLGAGISISDIEDSLAHAKYRIM